MIAGEVIAPVIAPWREKLTHPALSLAIPEGCPIAWIDGWRAALTACCSEGARVLDEPEPRGLQPAYLDGWRSALLLARALGVHP